MLHGTLCLYGVDVEALCARLVRQHRKADGLDAGEREDLVSYLIVECWRLSEKFNPERNDSFENYAAPLLRLRVSSWFRERFGRTTWKFADRTYEREPVVLVEFAADHEPRPGHADSVRPGGDQADSDAVVVGLLVDRRRYRARDLETLARAVPFQAPERTPV